MNNTKRSLLNSVVSMVLCISMLLGTTFAWFTDVAVSSGNIIQTGSLDIGMYWSDENLASDSDKWHNTEGNADDPIFYNDKWEPGYTEVRYVKVTNAGSLAFMYKMLLSPNGTVSKLAEVIDVSYDIVSNNNNFVAPTADNKHGSLAKVGTLADIISANGPIVGGVLLPEDQTAEGYYSGEIIVCIALHMQETAGNEYQGLSIGSTFNINLYATQFAFENDSFGNDYDADAQWPENIVIGNTAETDVQVDNNGNLSDNATMTSADGKISASVPAGTKLAAGANKLILNVADVENSNANITLGENEETLSIDVHINGVAEDNTTVMAIFVKELLPVGLNIGNYRLHHVEDGQTVEMSPLADGATPVHNNFTYDPATGDVTLYLASFSEIALTAEPSAWEGNRDYSWYDESKTELYIANADQLAGLGAIVGGMAKKGSDGVIYTSNGVDENATIVQDSFAGKTVKLVADINIADTNEYYTDASENGIVFYPIGYYNSEEKYEKDTANATVALASGLRNFEGTFDGDGHYVSNFYQNTWEMKGDHDWYDPIKEQYYRDGMGLFGRVYGGTIKNLTVKNFSSDGEITTTGTIAAYADFGATFENIAIVGCNPRVYNIGNGGIVGCVGWYTKALTDTPVTFRNITVDNSNKISALWGSYDVACGGIVGQYYPTSGQTSAGSPENAGMYFENCHVGAQMDVYNDVCANYQYYAYRYAGILVGSVRENETIDGRVYPDMDGITAVNCTVHFGDWNDYYYCELVANSLASYTHDHQMSRLTQVASVDTVNKTVTDLDGNTTAIPTSGRVNYVVVKTFDKTANKWVHGDGHDYAECYHFVNGAQHFHDIADTDNPNPTETVNGVAGVLKEDKQLIYREFNNLVTGYGWGVTSKGVEDMNGVTILDKTTANSVVKFEGKVQSLTTDTTYKISDIFTYLENCGFDVIPGAVAVGITNLDAEGNVIVAQNVVGEFTRDVLNWETGILSLTGTGKIMITIQDYYFCTATSIVVDVTEKSSGGSGSTTTTTIWEYYLDSEENPAGTPDNFATNASSAEKDSLTYGELDLSYCFKFDSNKYIDVKSADAGTLIVYCYGAKSDSSISIDGTTYEIGTSVNTLRIELEATADGSYHRILRNTKENYIYYVSFTFETTTGGGSGETEHTHSYIGTTTVAPTCSAEGKKLYTCSCGENYVETLPIVSDAHFVVDGKCKYCGKVSEEHVHSYTEQITKAPTCTTVGEKTFTCICGHTYTEVIDATGHTPGAAATCTTAQTCTVCKAVVTPALGHNYVDGKCNICGTTQTVVGSEVHNFTTNDKNSSFYTISGNLSTSKGTVTYEGLSLTQCLKIESSTNISFTAPAAGTLTLVFAESTPNIKVDGTKVSGSGGIITVDVAAGSHTITKADVMNLFYMVYTPSNAHTHSYSETITTPATCTSTGLKTLTCSCGDTKTQTIPMLAHTYTTVTVDSTCTKVGSITSTCSVCGDVETETIPMKDHSWSGGSCTTGMTCSVCNATKPATGHSFADATCTAPKTCTVCGATEGDALGHSWKDATCTSPKKCSRCGVTEGSIAAHTPGAEATCTAAQTCTACGAVITAALGHNYVNNVCTRCGKTKPSVEFIEEEGWFETAYAVWPAIDGADGYNVYVATAGSSTWTKLDDALVREYNGNYRADAVGLKAGSYQLQVVPKSGSNEQHNSAITTDAITVLEYDRSGFAHYNNTEGVGAYNDDGTLKDNAIVIYVTNENKNTVTVTSKDGTTVTGIGNILGSTGMDVGTGLNSKGGKANTNSDILRKLAQDGTPLVIRIIGSVKGASSTNLSSATSEIDGLTQYDGVDYGGTAGDNGFMARMSGGKNITIEGIGPDATIDGWGLHFICQTADYANGYGKNFEVRNITFKNVPEDCIGMEGQQEGSTLTAPVERCWIHNCSFIAPTITSPAESDKDGGDGACDFKRGNYMTMSYCYYDGYHKTNLVGSSDSSLQYHITWHHNYWKNCDSRGPLGRQANMHIYNCIYDGQTSYAMNPRANCYIFSEHNMFINTKNPVTVTSGGVVKSYNDSFTSCIGDNNATIVTNKSEKVSTSNKYANFDTDASLSYIPSGDYTIQEDHAEMKSYVMAYAGVMKQNIVGPDEVNISVIPADRMPTAAVVLPYSQSLNKTYISSNGTVDNIKFNVSKFNADSLTVGGTANGCDIVFYVDSTVNISMTEISGTYSPVLCNAAGVAVITGNGSAENLPAGYYYIQSTGYDVGSSKFKEAKVASLTIERAVVCNDHTFTSKVTAPTCTEGGYTTKTCTNCGYSEITDKTAAKGHTPGAAATCTNAQICTTCGTQLEAMRPHTNVDGKCTVCGKFDPATCTHTNVSSVVTAPTCSKQGYTTTTCNDCGKVTVGSYTDTIAHTAGAAATCTTAQICTVCNTVITAALGHNYVNNVCTRCEAEKPSMEAAGWLESAYAKWEDVDGATGYRAYVATANSSTWTQLDNLLIRQYSDHWRVDAVGLAAGSYQIRVVPLIDGTEMSDLAMTSETLTVAAHDRSGYAFVNGTSSGAYNEDGTLKSGAVVVYVTEQNKNSVSATINGATYTGISNILAPSVLKNATTPVCVRFIGNITDLGSGDAFDKGDLLVENKNNDVGLTLEGIGEDAVINGFGIRVKNASNIEIRNLAFMNCDSSEGDNVGLQQGNDHIWVHNCDFFYGDAGSDADQAKGDGQLDTKKSQYVTHSYNHFWDGGKVHLHGNGDTTVNYVSYHHNWYDHCDSRMPRVRVSNSVHVYNNFYDGVSKYGIGATTGCQIYSEGNYFFNTARPMMISLQGTDALGDGTFSGEEGGHITSYNDVVIGASSWITNVSGVAGSTAWSANDYDCVIVNTQFNKYSYNLQTAENAKTTVQDLAGRMGNDFTWEWTEADNADYNVNTELKSALVNYKTSIVSIGGVEE